MTLDLNVLIVITVVACFFMAFSVGANDAANAIGTAVGSGVLSFPKAILLVGTFESLGALFAGQHVTLTIGGGLIDTQSLQHTHHLVYGMLAALSAATTWILLASYTGWPVSTTQSIVGAIVGYALITVGHQAVHWHLFVEILLTWVVSPLLAAGISYALFYSVQQLIFSKKNLQQAALRYIPVYVFILCGVLLVTILIPNNHNYASYFLHSEGQAILVSAILALVVAVIIYYAMKRQFRIKLSREKAQVTKAALIPNIEHKFIILMLLTACGVAFSHGANDIANAIGPVAVMFNQLLGESVNLQAFNLPLSVLAVGMFGIISGLALCGYRVIETVGKNITALTPSRACVVQMSTMITILLSSSIGLPVSSTEILVGAVLGVGFAGGLCAIRFNVVARIFVSWIITVPVSVIISMIYFTLLSKILN